MRVRNILILLAILVILGGVYLVVSQPEAEDDSTEPTTYLWQIEMDEIEHIVVQLPRENKSQAFIKLSEGDWRFDESGYPEINPDRWGSGITLLLSGPAADKMIAEEATEEQLAEFGLAEPSMIITLALADETTMVIKLGDFTINGDYYILIPGTEVVATIDYTWHDVMERLVLDPPYVSAEE